MEFFLLTQVICGMLFPSIDSPISAQKKLTKHFFFEKKFWWRLRRTIPQEVESSQHHRGNCLENTHKHKFLSKPHSTNFAMKERGRERFENGCEKAEGRKRLRVVFGLLLLGK